MHFRGAPFVALVIVVRPWTNSSTQNTITAASRACLQYRVSRTRLADRACKAARRGGLERDGQSIEPSTRMAPTIETHVGA
jgi:hypothetical protein